MSSALVNTYPTYPFELVSGKGVHVYDQEGNQYLDLYGGHAVCGLGHNPAQVIEAIKEQASKLMFYSNLNAMKLRNKTAEKLIEFSNSGLSSVFFCNSGAEANENALKLAIKLTSRSKLLALKGGFHGRTTLASLVTDNDKWHKELHNWQGEVEFIEQNNLDEISKIDTSTAAVILEPIQSMAGAIKLNNDFLIALRKQTEKVGSMLIFDEIQTGMGRTGKAFVSGSSGVVPDMLTSAKALGSGFPVAAMLVSKEIATEIQIADLGSTFGGGPLAMAAVLATIETIEENNLISNAKHIGTFAKEIIEAEVHGQGCLLGIKLEKQAAKEINQTLREKKILCGLSQNPQVLRLLPALTIQEEHIKQFAQTLKEVS